MNSPTFEKVLSILRKEVKKWDVPIITLISRTKKDPFRVLIATVLSLRTKDQVTADASQRLFAQADSPTAMLELTEREIQKLIYPTGFYKVKSKNILLICEKLVKEYHGKVPNNMDELLKFPNVGRKTANLVLSEGFDIPAVCVDVHVNRISYRFGYVKTTNPLDTEMALRKKLPKKYWNEYNFI